MSLVLGEGAQQACVAGQVRHDAQLDLRVVRRQQHMAGRRDERLADAPALRACGSGCSAGSDRSTTAGRSPPRPGDSEVCTRPVRAIDLLRQLVGVGGLELGQRRGSRGSAAAAGSSPASSSSTSSAVEGWPVGVLRSTGSCSFSNRISCSCFGDSRLNSLPGRARAPAPASSSMLPRELAALLAQQRRGRPARRAAPCAAAPAPAAARSLRRARAARGTACELRPQRLVQPQRDVGVLGGVLGGALHRHLVEADLLGALAGDVLVVDGVDAEVVLRQRIHVVARGGAVQHVGLEHGVVAHARAARCRGCASTCASYFRWWPTLACAASSSQRLAAARARASRSSCVGRAGVVVRQRHVGGRRPARSQNDTPTISACM